MNRLYIKGGVVLTMVPGQEPIEEGVVCTEAERITYAGPASQAPQPAGAQVIDASGCIIMPGLVNSHTHVAMSLMRGVADDLPLQTWLTEHIFPLESRITPEAVYWGSMLGCLEMIRFGTTCFCDMYLFAQQVAAAADAMGVRAVVGEVLFDFPSPCYGELEAGFELTREFITHYQDHPRITVGVMPHSLYTCSRPLLERVVELAEEMDAPINIHMAENPEETEEVVAKWGKRPAEVALELGLLVPRTVINHGVDFSSDDIKLLARRDVAVAHCPESNMKLTSGIFRLTEALEAGLRVGLGTDGPASNNNLDMLGEMDSCAKLAKLGSGDPAAAPTIQVLELGTWRAAEALGLKELGRLEPGALADIIAVDTSGVHMQPLHNPASTLVYAAKGSDVLHTICHGKVLMMNREILVADEQEVKAKAREQARRLLEGGR